MDKHKQEQNFWNTFSLMLQLWNIDVTTAVLQNIYFDGLHALESIKNKTIAVIVWFGLGTPLPSDPNSLETAC